MKVAGSVHGAALVVGLQLANALWSPVCLLLFLFIFYYFILHSPILFLLFLLVSRSFCLVAADLILFQDYSHVSQSTCDESFVIGLPNATVSFIFYLPTL